MNCIRVLRKILTNLVNNRGEHRFRVLKLDNQALRSKVLSLPGGIEILMLTGWRFQQHGTALRLEFPSTNQMISDKMAAQIHSVVDLLPRP